MIRKIISIFLFALFGGIVLLNLLTIYNQDSIELATDFVAKMNLIVLIVLGLATYLAVKPLINLNSKK